ncbi:MAG TPA: universal stress protein [Acidimicrobiales bacterium]|nr:universal stress protein [Acidimicrobiales bacterium]
MFARILLAVEVGDAGSVATSFTVALARKCDATVHVVHVNEYLIGGRGLVSETPAEAVDVVGSALRDLHAAGVRATGVTYRTTHFDVPGAICDLAERVRADVIVVGSRRRRLPSLLKRRTRSRIAAKTSLPVVTAPAPLRVGKRQRALEAAPAPDISVRS